MVFSPGKRWKVWNISPILFIAAILFFIPFFWFAPGEGDFGGDSSRLYFVDPGAWLKHHGLSEININDYGFHNPAYFLIPFLLLLQGLHLLFFNQVYLVLSTFNGLLLATAFLSVYLIIRDLHLGEKNEGITRLSAILGALFFVLAPVMAYNWQKALYSWHQIAAYPLLVWLFLRYIQRQETKHLLYGLLLTVLFAPNFSAYAAPALFSFWPLVLPLLFVYAALHKKVRWLLRGLAIFIPLFLLLHSFQIIPQLASLFSPSNTLYQNAFTETGKTVRGLPYFEGVRPMVKLVYNLTAFPQYSLYVRTNVAPYFLDLLTRYGISSLAVFFSFPAVILLGVLLNTRQQRKQRILFFTCVLLFAGALFFITGNLFGLFGPRGYAALFSLPGFAMFRSFYGVFVVPYIFLYALCLGMGLRYVLTHISRYAVRGVLVAWLIVVLLYGSFPFLTGKVVNTIMSDTNNIRLSNQFPSDFVDILTAVKNIETDGKWLTTPLTNSVYQIIEGADGGAYVGPSPLALLGGKHAFSGLSTFTIPGSAVFTPEFFLARVEAEDYESLRRLFALMNIGFIFENNSSFVYRDGFIGWPYSQELWKAFPATEDWHRLIQKLDYVPLVASGPYTVYHNPNDFLPHFYIPHTVVSYRSPHELQRYLTNQEDYDLRTAFFLTEGDFNTTAIKSADSTTIEVKKINEMKYQIHLYNVRGDIPIVFSHAWHPGWKLKVNNQPAGALWKSWFLPTIDDTYHRRANEYANAWLLDLDYLQNQFGQSLVRRSDGGYDLELTLEFTPRRIFFAGAFVSIATLITLLGYLLWTTARSRLRAYDTSGRPED